MYIEEISLEGFKSYAQRTVVPRFDPKFNAITGLNGSGKSNILDSICFVLGITNLQQVRAGSLQELVYKQGQAGVTRATVSIVFNNSDRRSSPVGFEEHKQITVTRQIVIGGRNKYLINGHVAQPSRVQNLFHSVQLNVNNPHFLIMQGRITKVLNMKPPEILSMLEEAAGTRMYEVKKEGALKTLDKKQAKVDEINTILADEILPALEKLRRERAAYQQWLQGSADIDRLRRFCVAWEYVQAMRAKETALEVVEGLRGKIAEITEADAELAAGIEERQRKIEEVVAEKERRVGPEMKRLVERAEVLSKDLVKVTSVWSNKKSSLESEVAMRDKLLASLKELHEGSQSKVEKLKAADGQLAVAAEQASTREQELRHAEEELEAVQAGKSGHPGEDKSMAETLADTKAAAVSAATEAKQMSLRLQHLKKELAQKRTALASRQKEAGRNQQALGTMESEVGRLEAALRSNGHDEARAAQLEQARSEAQAAVQTLQQRVGQAAAELNVGFAYKDPQPGFDHSRVKGVLARLFAINSADLATALEVVAGGKLFNVVLDSEQTGKELLSRGGLRRRVTFIPLNKIDGRTIPNHIVDKARRLVGTDNVWPALSLISYDPSLQPAMAFAFGSHFVCRDSESAKKVAFHPDIMTPCVTLEGDSYNPGGLLTGGSRSGGGQLLTRIAAMRHDETTLAAKQSELQQVSAELAAMEAAAKRHRAMSADLQLATHKLGLLKEQLKQSEVQQLADEVAAMQEDMEETTAAHTEALQRKEELEKKAADLQREMEEMGRERGKRLKALEEKVKRAKKEVANAAKLLKAAEKEKEKLQLEIMAAEGEETTLKEQIHNAESEIETLRAAVDELNSKAAAAREAHEAAAAEVQQRREELKACDLQVKTLEKEVRQMTEKRTTNSMEAKRLEHQARQREAEQQNGAKAVERLLRQHEWIATEKAAFGRAGSDYDFEARDPDEARRLLAQKQAEQSSLEKQVNKKVMSMFERAEQEYRDLDKRKGIILRDKAKIEDAIEQLDEQKKATLKITWEKVTRDFGSIFSTLLPGTTAKLEPPEGEDFLAGLEVKVAFGGVWKQSLSELSGGQRSLLALSLILALLLFKPAPLYILDEVDAALDLSHTQNIGRMIKNHFPHSQFIVVSLKEGMFNNANVIFRTKFVDGVSTVTRTANAAAIAASASARANDGEEEARRRKAGGGSTAARAGWAEGPQSVLRPSNMDPNTMEL